MLINSVKDVALALNNLINVTKTASGKQIDDPEMQKLKETAKIMVTNVTALLRTVKSVEDETQRGTNALEATIESIGQELRLFNNGQIPINQTTPEELIRVTKQVREKDFFNKFNYNFGLYLDNSCNNKSRSRWSIMSTRGYHSSSKSRP